MEKKETKAKKPRTPSKPKAKRETMASLREQIKGLTAQNHELLTQIGSFQQALFECVSENTRLNAPDKAHQTSVLFAREVVKAMAKMLGVKPAQICP